MEHLIAKNAIKTREELTIGKEIWHVYGYFRAAGTPVKEIITVEPYEEDGSWWFQTDKQGEKSPRSCRDCNIGDHYNSNYIFDNEADAVAYGNLVRNRCED